MLRCNSQSEFWDFRAGKFCFVQNPEKASSGAEDAEKPKEGGIPIDAKAAERKKSDLDKWEELIKKKYGGDFYNIESNSGKSEAYIDAPDFSDEKFQGKQPRVIVWFGPNGAEQHTDHSHNLSKNMHDMVKKMRESGDPVVLVTPRKSKKNWGEFHESDTFQKLVQHAEQLTGQRLRDNISFGASSGGYHGVGKVLEALDKSGDPFAKELYRGVKSVGLCDAMYNSPYAHDAIAKWAVSSPDKTLRSYSGTSPVQKANTLLKKRVEELLAKQDRKLEDANIDIALEKLHPGGHAIDWKLLGEYMERPKTAVEGGLNWPPRSPDAMTGKEFNEALAKCTTLKQRQELILSQAAKGAFSPGFRKPKMYTTTVGGKEVKIPLYGMVRFGEPGNETIVSMDGQTSQAIADMLGGHLPTADLYKQLYADPKVQKAPFWYGKKIEGLVHSRIQGKLPFEVEHKGRKIVSGKAMQSAPYAEAESDMYFRWCKQNGIDPDTFTVGHRKTVFMPREQGQAKITFGGGLHAMPVFENGELVNYKVQEGQFVQGVGDNAHEPTWHDYAQGTDIMGDPTIDGKVVPLAQIFSDPKYADIRSLYQKKKTTGMTRYELEDWMDQRVADYHKKYPPGENRSYATPVEIGSESKETPVAQVEEQPSGGGGIPVDTRPAPAAYAGGGGGYGGGSYGGGGEVAPASYSPPSSAEQAQQHAEVQSTGKVFVLGDSLSDGFVPGLSGVDLTHAHPVGKEKSMGQTAHTMVSTLKQKILNQENLAGSTLVIVGGSNDIFAPNSLESIKKNLREIYTLAKARGMKVVGATLPPLAHSTYAKDWANKTNTPYEQYNTELVDRWQKINEWIMGQEGAKDSSGQAIGPDKVIQLHKKFEDPSTPGKLAAQYASADGVHLSNYGDMSQLLRGGINEVQPPVAAGAEFMDSPEFSEQTTTYEYPPGDAYPLHVHINKPKDFDASKKTRVIMYGLPLGNTIAQTIGRIKEAGQDWHFNIQDIGAQTRALRKKYPNENIVVSYLQGPENSLNQWRKKHANSPELLVAAMDDVRKRVGAPNAEISLAGHSAGGGFQREVIEHYAAIPDHIKRLNFLDSFHFLNVQKHGPKILQWLKASSDHRFSVISYEDNLAKMEFQGKGSSIARAMELVKFLQDSGVELNKKEVGGDNGYIHYEGMNGQVNIIIMKNPTGAILHTETVKRNGLIVAETGTMSDFNKISYNQYIQKGHTDTTPRQPKAPEAVAQDENSQEYQVAGWRVTGPGKYNKSIQKFHQDIASARSKVPGGYKSGAPNPEAGKRAWEILGKGNPLGTTTTFTVDGQEFLALDEWHFKPSAGWHHGVSIFHKEKPETDEGIA